MITEYPEIINISNRTFEGFVSKDELTSLFHFIKRHPFPNAFKIHVKMDITLFDDAGKPIKNKITNNTLILELRDDIGIQEQHFENRFRSQFESYSKHMSDREKYNYMDFSLGYIRLSRYEYISKYRFLFLFAHEISHACQIVSNLDTYLKATSINKPHHIDKSEHLSDLFGIMALKNNIIFNKMFVGLYNFISEELDKRTDIDEDIRHSIRIIDVNGLLERAHKFEKREIKRHLKSLGVVY